MKICQLFVKFLPYQKSQKGALTYKRRASTHAYILYLYEKNIILNRFICMNSTTNQDYSYL